MNEPTLPPILYWSPSLAEHANREELDPRHGLIDATDADTVARMNGGHVVQREIRRGQWKPAVTP